MHNRISLVIRLIDVSLLRYGIYIGGLKTINTIVMRGLLYNTLLNVYVYE